MSCSWCLGCLGSRLSPHQVAILGSSASASYCAFGSPEMFWVTHQGMDVPFRGGPERAVPRCPVASSI